MTRKTDYLFATSRLRQLVAQVAAAAHRGRSDMARAYGDRDENAFKKVWALRTSVGRSYSRSLVTRHKAAVMAAKPHVETDWVNRLRWASTCGSKRRRVAATETEVLL